MTIMLGRNALGRAAAGAGAVAIALTVVACGGGSTSSAPTPTADPAKAQTEAFCNAVVDLDTASAGPPPVDFATATPEQIKTAIQAQGEKLQPLLVKVEQATPAAAKQDVDTLARLARQAFTTGDPAAFESPEFTTADANVDKYMLANCGWPEVKITATDHEYAGEPSSLKAGTVAFTLVNDGAEIHELALARINDGVSEPLDALLALPEEQALQKVTPVGTAFAAPKESDTAFVRLTPGRYGLVCFIPEGTKPPAEGTGPPHFTLGMKAELTVT